MARRRVRSDEERRIRADERLREELSRGCEYSGTQEIVQETFEEMREQLGMEGDAVNALREYCELLSPQWMKEPNNSVWKEGTISPLKKK